MRHDDAHGSSTHGQPTERHADCIWRQLCEAQKRVRRDMGPADTEARTAMKLALFLGAGASVQYDMPTTNTLKEMLREAQFPFEGILTRRDYPDVEYILPALDDIIHFSESDGGEFWAACTGDQFRDMISRAKTAKQIIEREIFSRYKWDAFYDTVAQSLLSRLFSLVKSEKGHATIFTTNFDTAIEEYCGKRDRNIRCVNGFTPHSSRDMHVWRGNFRAGDDPRPKIFLYKLHGSLSWQKQNIDGRDTIVHKTDTRAAEDPSNDVFIRPTLNVKGKILEEEPYRTIIKEFNRILPSFDACIVIGYSFRDTHISARLVDFIRRGKTVVALSPTATADFSMHALNNTQTAGDVQNWNAKEICSFSFMGKGTHGFFYGIHKKFDADGISTIKHVLESKPTNYNVGSIPQTNE